MSKVSREERGWAGHLCVADGCRFRRNTLLWSGETYVVVSTVGNYCYQGKPDEIGCNRMVVLEIMQSETPGGRIKERRMNSVSV